MVTCSESVLLQKEQGRRELLSCSWLVAYVTYVPAMAMTKVDRGMARRSPSLPVTPSRLFL